jgi:hypothetical protein
MRKIIMILAFAVPLLAQEAKDDPFHATVGKEKKESTGKKVVRTLQDMEWRKFDAAHKRAHSKRGEYAGRESMGDKRQKMHKKQQIKNIVRLAVVGGLAYYIGYHQGEEHFKGGMKRRPYLGDRK